MRFIGWSPDALAAAPMPDTALLDMNDGRIEQLEYSLRRPRRCRGDWKGRKVSRMEEKITELPTRRSRFGLESPHVARTWDKDVEARNHMQMRSSLFKKRYRAANVSSQSNPVFSLSPSSSSTAMAETQAQPAAPELTIFHRVGSIPLVADSLDTLHQTLSTNPYTRSPYATAQGLTQYALGYTQPLQKSFAPLLVRADGLANKGLDVVESRYPYPFKTPTEDIVKDLKGRSDQARDIATKTIDEKVKTPALTVAQGIDQVSTVSVFSTYVILTVSTRVVAIRARRRLLPGRRKEDPFRDRHARVDFSHGSSEVSVPARVCALEGPERPAHDLLHGANQPDQDAECPGEACDGGGAAGQRGGFLELRRSAGESPRCKRCHAAGAPEGSGKYLTSHAYTVDSRTFCSNRRRPFLHSCSHRSTTFPPTLLPRSPTFPLSSRPPTR